MNSFFSNSEWLDREALRPLSHCHPNWELTWDHEQNKYEEEQGSFAKQLNLLIQELESTAPPSNYHAHEDRLAEATQKSLNWNIKKDGRRWVGEEYAAILEQGGFHDTNEHDLVQAAAGRVRAAINRGQLTYDAMENSHRIMLAALIAIILYHRTEADE